MKGLAVAEEIMRGDPSSHGNGITVQVLDLNDLESVLNAVKGINSKLAGATLDILVLNAGVIAKTLARTAQGYEKGWGVNVVGHYALTQKLLPLTTEATHIVAVSSVAHWVCKEIGDDVDFEHGRKFSGWQSYGQSKLGLLLYMKYLARNPSLYKGKAYSVHPGAIATTLQDGTSYVKFMFKMFSWWTKTPEQGAATTVYACTDFVDAPNGAYLKDCQDGRSRMAKQGDNVANGNKMVAIVEESLKHKFPSYFEVPEGEISGGRSEKKTVGERGAAVEVSVTCTQRPPLQLARKNSRATVGSDSEIVSKVSRLASVGMSESADSGGGERKDSIPALH